MSGMQRTPAIVLRRTNYGEADRIVQFLTPNGQRSVIAKGARREKSKLASAIELFTVSDIVVRQGSQDLGVLLQARIMDFYGNILADYDRLQFGYTAIGMVARESRSLDEPAWYEVLRQTYVGLNNFDIPLILVETWFYVRCMALMGYDLNLSIDVIGHRLVADKRYMYDSTERALRPSQQGPITAEHIKLLRIIATHPLEFVAQIGGTEPILPDCWLLARQHAAI